MTDRRDNRGNRGHAAAAAATAVFLLAFAFHPDPASAQDAAPPAKPAAEPAPQPKPDPETVERERRRVGELLEDVLPTLDETRGLIDRHDSLPKRTFNPFGSDQGSNNEDIDELLDEAIAMLDSAALAEARDQIRQLQANVREAHADVAEYRRKRIAAPRNADLGVIDSVNPFVTTKEGYDESIAEAEGNIADWEEQMAEQRERFAGELRGMGLQLDDDAVDSLLYSVSGDEFVDMTIVFDNVRAITEQLQTLTEQSGEALDTAKRYYGMYVVMVRMVDRLQDRFVARINDEHIPRLEEFAEQARDNIKEARKLIKNGGGNERILLANIDSNETTAKAAELYIKYLRDHAQIIARENAEIEKNLATAMNTYKTVKLSSALAELMKTSRRDFDALMQLKVPYLREFRNDEIRRELQRMTEQLRK